MGRVRRGCAAEQAGRENAVGEEGQAECEVTEVTRVGAGGAGVQCPGSFIAHRRLLSLMGARKGAVNAG